MDYQIYLIVVLTFALALLYAYVGLGVAKMAAKINNRQVRSIDIFAWWLTLIVFASCDECQ